VHRLINQLGFHSRQLIVPIFCPFLYELSFFPLVLDIILKTRLDTCIANIVSQSMACLFKF
jgi:hypothetical protein